MSRFARLCLNHRPGRRNNPRAEPRNYLGLCGCFFRANLHPPEEWGSALNDCPHLQRIGQGTARRRCMENESGEASSMLPNDG